ncbi:MAG: hypothetical protein M3177_11820, partial [Pseudomonadota bacterium]|nr:hypothetical protein [Pseudomonadota bacterium]
TEGQLARARLTAAAAARVAQVAQPLGNLSDIMEREPSLLRSRSILELMTHIEAYENRREALRVDLNRLEAQSQ